MTYPLLCRPEKGVELALLGVQEIAAARADFAVDGRGLSVAILDTGLTARGSGADAPPSNELASRVRAQVNFTRDNYGKRDDASDGDGHGTSVASVLAGAPHGVAPGAGVVPIKVLANAGEGSFDTIELALGWVLNNHAKHDISVVCIALSSATSETSDEGYRDDGIRARIGTLRQRDIPVIASSGDAYLREPREGMAYPAILRECISVGELSPKGQPAPFSQRLSEAHSPNCPTDIFAPGGAARVAGVVLLMQAYFRRHSGKLPPVALIEWCLHASATTIYDHEEGADNGAHTKQELRGLDAPAALRALHGRMRGIAIANGEPDLRPPTIPPAGEDHLG